MSEENNDKEKFAVAYIQNQEKYIMDLLREKFNMQIQFNGLAESHENYKRLYEQSQNEVAKQNSIIKQATTSIEKLTIDLKSSENVSTDRMELINQLNQKIVDYENLTNVHRSAQKEIERLNSELNLYVEENNLLVKQLEQFVSAAEPKTESKKTKKKVTHDEDTF